MNLWIYYHDHVFSVAIDCTGRKNHGLVNSLDPVVHGLGGREAREAISGWKNLFPGICSFHRVGQITWFIMAPSS